MQVTIFRVTELIRHLLDKSSDHGMHDSMVCISLLSVAVELIASEYRPVLLVPISLCLEEALALIDLLLCRLLLLSKSLHNCVTVRDVGRVVFLLIVLYVLSRTLAHVMHCHVHFHRYCHHGLSIAAVWATQLVLFGLLLVGDADPHAKSFLRVYW